MLMYVSCTSCTSGPAGDNGGPAPDDKTVLADEMEYYEFAPQIMESTKYTVKANGTYIFVYPTIEPHLAWVGAGEGKVKCEITLQDAKAESVVVHPVAKNYEQSFADGKLTLYLEAYDRVSVEFNGDMDNPLFLFVNPIDREKPSKDDPSVLYFEGGKVHEAGAITLTPECREVYLEPGCIVNGTIFGRDVNGVKIHGGGFLNTYNCARSDNEFYQPFSIALARCENSEVRDITNLSNSGGWESLYTNCHNSNIINVKTLGTNSAPGVKTNNDSMDIIGGINVHVSKCFLYGHDDCYCLKSQKFKLKGDVDGIWYEDCIGWNVDAGNTFEIGYETNVDIRNVHYRDIYAIHSGTGVSDLRRAGLSIHNGAAGTVSNVTYENAYLEDVMEFAVYLACLKHNYNIGYDDEGNPLTYSPGRIDGVTYTNVNVMSVREGKGLCVIQGYDASHNVSNVTFNGFSYLGRQVTSLDDAIWKTKRNYSDINFN